jgi:hypothetical protein
LALSRIAQNLREHVPAGIETNSLIRLFYWVKTDERRQRNGIKRIVPSEKAGGQKYYYLKGM